MSGQEEEKSSRFFIFGKGRYGNEGGGREIFPLGFTKQTKPSAYLADEKGNFMMVDGNQSYYARYKEDKRTWIPKDVSDTESPVQREATYNEILIMFAELHYGAKWNPDTAQLEITEESQKWHMNDPVKFSQYLGRFKNMDHLYHLVSSGTKDSRIETGDNGLAVKFGVEGFSKDMYQRYLKVVKAYQNPDAEHIKKGIKPIIGKKLTKEDRLRMEKTKFTAKPAEIELKWRKTFYADPYIIKWMEIMEDKNIETRDNIRSTIARVFLINNYLNPNAFKKITIGSVDEPDEVRIKRLKRLVALWKRWNKEYLTPPSFYKQKWIDKLYDKTEQLEFPENLYNALIDFSERDHKSGLPRDYPDPKQAEESARKRAADVLVAFIDNAPEGEWHVDDQPPKTMLSRKIPTIQFAEHGANIDDKQVREAMKFLETGKIHKWVQKINAGKPVFREDTKFNPETQKEESVFEKVNELVPDETDDNLHYNDQLKEYQQYGNPYTPTSPASMLFRLSILCGWRKSEALTATTRIRKKATLIELADFGSEEKPSGLSIVRSGEHAGLLKISFLTRKTKKRGAEGAFFTVVIPPFSSSVMDTRETIELVCKKAGIGKWSNTDYFRYHDVEKEDEETKKITHYWVEEENDKWIPQIVELDQKEKDELFPALNIKSHGKTIHRSKGTKSEWLIGDNGQFYRETALSPQGKMIPTYDMPDGTGEFGIAKLAEKEMIRAYIDFPLRECYAIMSGTTVSYQSDSYVMDLVRDDHKTFVEQNKKHRTFTMLKGWSQVCDLGCPSTDLGKKQTGKYSKERMDQDQEKYKTDDEDYWLERTIHSLRHIFAQLWLRKSKWNFGVVADRGHWETLDTLKKHYGGIPEETLGDFMTEVLASDQIGADKMDQAVNRSIALRSQKGGYSQEMSDVIKEQDVQPELTEEEKKKEEEEKKNE